MTDLTGVSLFAGIGGIDRALERAGVRVVAAVEIDPACRDILRRHFPDVTLFNDVTEVTGEHLRAAGFVPGRGILAAGWPCQGNSVAGRRGGMADPRSGLWMHVVRLLAELHPCWFLGENVPGLLSVNDGADITVVRGDLAQLGYWWAERILDAQFFGVPQRRRRVFFVGCPGDPRGPVEVLLEPQGGSGDHPQGSQARPGTTSTAGGSTVSSLQGGGRRGHRIDAEGAAGGHLIAHAITAREGKGPDSDASTGFVLASIPVQDGRSFEKAQNGIGIGVEGERRFTLDTTGAQAVAALPVAHTLTAGTAVGEGVNPPGRRHEDDFNLVTVPVALRGRDEGSQIETGVPGEPAFTIRASTGGSSHGMVATFGGEGMRDAFTSEGADASEDGTGRGTPIISLAVAGDFSSSIDRAQTGRSAHGQPGVIAVGFAENQRGEVVESEVSHQLTTGGGKPGQGFLAVRQEALVRRLTPTECERLQGFPDGWTDGQADATRYRQLGNSVAVPCVEWIARRIVAADSSTASPVAANDAERPSAEAEAPASAVSAELPGQQPLFELGAA